MLFHIDTDARTASPAPTATLSSMKLRERYDLQEWVLHTPALLGEELFIIADEVSQFDRTAERLDLLALDRRGKLVVVELKRTAVGTSAELQALRYAAFCSTFSLDDVLDIHRGFLARRYEREASTDEIREELSMFVQEPDFFTLDNKPRIILAAEEFSPEITANVLWLREFDVDISCVRLRPYMVNDQLLLDSTVLIPLPEAEQFLIRRGRKAADRSGRGRRPIEASEILGVLPDSIRSVFLRIRDWLINRQEVEEAAFRSVLTYRHRTNQNWITWLQFTQQEVRVAVHPDIPVDPAHIVSVSRDGWPIIALTEEDDVAEAERLLASAIARVEGAGSGEELV